MRLGIKNDVLRVEIEMEKEPKQSESGKTIVLAKTGGFKETPVQYDGKPVYLGLTAYIKNGDSSFHMIEAMDDWGDDSNENPRTGKPAG